MEMTIDTGNSDPILQKPYPIAMKTNNGWKKKMRNCLQQKLSAAISPAGQHQLSSFPKEMEGRDWSLITEH